MPTSAPAPHKPDATLPRLLSDADVGRYTQIFRLQAKGKWADADKLMDQLDDRLLMVSAEAQRYLSPAYRTKYAELEHWLAANADAPDARRIYALAVKRRGKGDPAPTQPVVGDGRGIAAAAAASYKHGHDDIGIGDETVSDRNAPLGQWRAGLAAWRAGHIDQAKRDFEAASRIDGRSPWTSSAAAFWAARAELRSDHPELFNYWLGIAAQHPRTFYGLLARRTLGVDSFVEVTSSDFSELDAQILTGIPAGRRTLALLQIGDSARAEAELRALAMRASNNLLEAIVALAERANMASLAVEIAAKVADTGADDHDRAQYPLPHWSPRGGFQVDRALLYGLMRQESKFKPVAHNASGAAGLMQLMPETARTMAKHTGVHGGWADPAVNLALAQQYVIELLSDQRVNGNLLYFAVAYNRGPSVLPQIKSKAASRGDPLLFVESVANNETRHFIHQVLTNYWIYRLRLGQPTPDLDALAAGEWPIYTALDDSAEAKLRHADNR